MKTIKEILESGKDNDLIIIGLFDEIIRMSELYKEGRFTQSDKVKSEIIEMLDDIQRLKL